MNKSILVCACAVTAGSSFGADSVSVALTGVRIQNGLAQSRSSNPQTLTPAYKYFIDFSNDTMVRGRSGLLSILYPNPTPLATVMESFQPGSSASLHSYSINPAGTHPFQTTDQPVTGNTTISGIAVTFAMTLSSGIDASNFAYFNITNVAITPSALVGSMEFTSGSVVISRGCVGDYNNDGGVDGADVETFFTAWEAGDAAADLNADGGVDGADVEFFFTRWQAGC